MVPHCVPKGICNKKSQNTCDETFYCPYQMTSYYNVEKPWQLANPDYDSFNFEVDNLVFSGRNASSMEMTICTE